MFSQPSQGFLWGLSGQCLRDMGSPRPTNSWIIYHQGHSFTPLPDNRDMERRLMTLLHQGLGHKILEVSDHSCTSCTFLFILNGPKSAFSHIRNLKIAGLWPKNPGILPFFLQSSEMVSVGTLKFKKPLELCLWTYLASPICIHATQDGKKSSGMVARIPLKQPSVKVLA